ncbi:MAG: hypothetical protein ABGX04_09880, partial [Myxococcales bacterium]
GEILVVLDDRLHLALLDEMLVDAMPTSTFRLFRRRPRLMPGPLTAAVEAARYGDGLRSRRGEVHESPSGGNRVEKSGFGLAHGHGFSNRLRGSIRLAVRNGANFRRAGDPSGCNPPARE